MPEFFLLSPLFVASGKLIGFDMGLSNTLTSSPNRPSLQKINRDDIFNLKNTEYFKALFHF